MQSVPGAHRGCAVNHRCITLSVIDAKFGYNKEVHKLLDSI